MANRKQQFKCFDSLPAKLREILANAAFPWDATLIAEAIDLGVSPDLVLSKILEDERRRLPIDNYVMYGPEHPGSAPNVQPNLLKFYHYPINRTYWWTRPSRPS
jgi:hypothetical protein